jgi:plasmid maintenance system antidote protein VapI
MTKVRKVPENYCHKNFGTMPGFWMKLQLRWDSYRAQQVEAEQLEKIEPYHQVASSHRVAERSEEKSSGQE